MGYIQDRVIVKRETTETKGPVIYWMSREQRIMDNWSLIYAIRKAKELKKELFVIFFLDPEVQEKNPNQFNFMVKGLQEVEKNLRCKNIQLILIRKKKDIQKTIDELKPSLIITDFFPLRKHEKQKEQIRKDISWHEVDSHNIVPYNITSIKQEYAAHTIRNKIKNQITQHLKEYPRLQKLDQKIDHNLLNWDKIVMKTNHIDWIHPGEKEAIKDADFFIKNRLKFYPQERNNPNKQALSNLSPFLHHGHISSQTVALKILKSNVDQKIKDAYLEELIIRKELSDNFCHYNKKYDSVKGFPDWAKKTLKKHEKDKREYIYSLKELEKAKTHDQLWNASQRQMLKNGKMHSFLRMYWAKKILEWSKDAGEAMEKAIWLNDKYELDSNDPNGYVGIAWSIGGVHDGPWGKREIYGMVRYMNYDGCKRKFNVKEFISQYGE